jgi:PAS domain S-box-containing protein
LKSGDPVNLLSLLGRNGFLPHGYCFTWSPGLLWSMVAADLLVALAYFSIPISILVFAKVRPDRGFHRVAMLFSAFILACGLTHLMDVWTIWQPDYWAQLVVKAATAALSLATAFAVWRLIPVAARLPSVDALQDAIARLESEIALRRTAQVEAGDAEQDLAMTLASIDAGMIATDAQGNVTRMNAVAERLTGWSNAEAHGRTYWEVLAREDRPTALLDRTVVEVLADRGPAIGTAHRFCVLSRTGTRTLVEVKGELKRARDGTVDGMLALLQDKTGEDRAEEDRRRLAAIVESSNDAIIGKSLDGRITSWNRAAADLFGYTAAEIVGASVQQLIPADRREEEMDILASIFDGNAVPPFETVRLAKDGRRLDLSVTISPIRDGSGRIVGGSKIARDIGPQRRMLAALRESEARLRFALEVARIGDWDLDLRSGAMHRSVRHDHCFGYDALQPEWSISTFLEHVHPQDRQDVALSYRRGLLREQDWRSEFRVVWPDGSVHWLRMHGSTRYDTGDANRMLGIVADLTEQRSAEEARLRAERLESDNRQIQESNRLKSQFLANMSHELRSPLNAIIGFSDLLCSDTMPVAPEKQRQFIGHIRTSGRHLLQLINDVLDLSKVESGKFEFYPEPVRLAELIGEVRNVLFSLLQRKRLTLDVDVAPAVASVVTDPARLKQALFNYLSNAIKFSAEGGALSVRALPEGAQAFRIEVTDFGVGIAQADLPRLFVEFQQLDDGYTKRHQGTGLGLALTRRLVQAQGGSVGVRSVLGQGSTFHLVLPMAPGLATGPGDGAAGLPDSSGTSAGHVLVIGDHPGDRSRITEALAHGGIRVDVAADASQAVVQARTTVYDGLVVDLTLDARDVLEVLAQMRGASDTMAPTVLAITLVDKEAGTGGFAVEDVLTKPLQTAEVIHAMTRLGIVRRRGASVVVIDDDPVALDLMRAALGDLGIQALCFDRGAAALEAMREARPSAIVLDLIMPEMDGFDVLDRLSRDPGMRDTPVFVWSALVLTDSEYDLLATSASAILRKGGGELESMLERLRRWRSVGPRPAAETR